MSTAAKFPIHLFLQISWLAKENNMNQLSKRIGNETHRSSHFHFFKDLSNGNLRQVVESSDWTQWEKLAKLSGSETSQMNFQILSLTIPADHGSVFKAMLSFTSIWNVLWQQNIPYLVVKYQKRSIWKTKNGHHTPEQLWFNQNFSHTRSKCQVTCG